MLICWAREADAEAEAEAEGEKGAAGIFIILLCCAVLCCAVMDWTVLYDDFAPLCAAQSRQRKYLNLLPRVGMRMRVQMRIESQ